MWAYFLQEFWNIIPETVLFRRWISKYTAILLPFLAFIFSVYRWQQKAYQITSEASVSVILGPRRLAVRGGSLQKANETQSVEMTALGAREKWRQLTQKKGQTKNKNGNTK